MENAIKIQIPISVSYPAIEEVLKKQMVGEYIPKPEADNTETPYAQILDVGIAKSSAGANDIILNLKIRVLRTVLKRDKVDLFVRATLAYDSATEQLFVERFNLESRTTSGLYNTGLEVLVNKVAYSQILHKTRFNLKALIQQELIKVNNSLEKGLELKGLKLQGAISNVKVQDMQLQPSRLTVWVELKGDVEADVFDLLSLMPANQQD